MPITPPRHAIPEQQEITRLLLAWRLGEGDALDSLIALVYRRMKGLAASFLRAERHDHFETTELVHEAFVRLVEIERIEWRDRNHFFAVCARVMRRILVDHARYRTRAKRGAETVSLSFGERSDPPGVVRFPELIALDDALRDLARHEPQMAQIVELRYFGGLNRNQIADVLGTSSRTVTRRWRLARAWLTRSMRAVG